MSTIKVHYFDGYGAADQIRALLAHAKVPFEDVRYTREEWGAVKESGKFEFKQVPVLEVDGKFYAQTISILRMLGKQHGYYTEDPAVNYRIDSTIDALGDLKQAMGRFAFEQDEEKKKAGFHNFIENVFPPWATAIEKRLAANSSPHHAVGDKTTIADFALGGWAYSCVYNDACPPHAIFQEAVGKFPHLQAYLVHLGEHELKEHLTDRKPSPF